MAVEPPPPPIEIPGPPSSLTNSLMRSHAPEDGLARFAAAQNVDEIAKRLGVHPLVPLQAPEDIECPRCAERIKSRAKVCRFCGAEFEDRERRSGSNARLRVLAPTQSAQQVHQVHHFHQATRTGASPGVAAVLSFFFIGLGQIYAGRALRGFTLMGCVLGVAFISAIMHEQGNHQSAFLFAWGMGLVVWIVGIVDAMHCADSIDATTQEMLPSKRRRWPFRR